MASNSLEIQIKELKDTILKLNNTIDELNKIIASKDSELAWFRKICLVLKMKNAESIFQDN